MINCDFIFPDLLGSGNVVESGLVSHISSLPFYRHAVVRPRVSARKLQ